jgi:hypothetical protein
LEAKWEPTENRRHHLRSPCFTIDVPVCLHRRIKAVSRRDPRVWAPYSAARAVEAAKPILTKATRVS